MFWHSAQKNTPHVFISELNALTRSNCLAPKGLASRISEDETSNFFLFQTCELDFQRNCKVMLGAVDIV